MTARIVMNLMWLLAGAIQPVRDADLPAPIYLWLEPEWFEGVEGNFAYWPGPDAAKPTSKWGIAGPGISPEWSQGGESEWNSMGVCAAETRAECHRAFVVPRAGKFRVWVRYVDHRGKSEPFTARVEQSSKPAVASEFGVRPVVPPNDEYQLYWGFSFGWDSVEGTLAEGAATLRLAIERAGEAWRQVDAVLITDDLAYTPVGREKPPFGYLDSFAIQPKDGAMWRGNAKGIGAAGGMSAPRPKLGGRDFAMWTAADSNPKWWSQQPIDSLTLNDVLFQFAPPADIREKFHQQFAGRRDLPVLNWPKQSPGFYLGATPDLSPDSPLRRWLERTKTPFYILTNYANPTYTDKTGPATFQALAGPLAEQFLGYIHGESVGTGGVRLPDKPLGATRREHVAALGRQLVDQQAAEWTKMYKTPVPPDHFAKGISCLSTDSIALAHAFHEAGARVVGYEEDATNVHVPMRIAFERGAARQFGGAWINYASGNFGDACNYFTQNPVVNRAAGGWFHSKYAVTDGVSIGWYRKLYYLNFLGGAAAIFWEQGLGNQWILPGPGTHPIELSPFGRATEDFQAFVDRLPDRGEPVTPIAILLSSGHGYERVNYLCKMLGMFQESAADLELRELFNVCWHPAGVVEGQPAAPDVQSLPSGVYGNIFDVLVDRPDRAKALFDYPVVIAAGDVDLGGAMLPVLRDYVAKGGTLVVNIDAAAGKLPPELLGLRPLAQRQSFDSWVPAATADAAPSRRCVPYEVERIELAGASVLAWAGPAAPLITRHAVGDGAVIVSLVPRLVGRDERAHSALPFLMNGLTAGLLPVEVLVADAAHPNGRQPTGEVMYEVNRTKDGYLVALFNNRGVDKTQNGIARVDRRAFVDVVLRPRSPVRSAKEFTQPRDLAVEKIESGPQVRVRVHPGDVHVVEFRVGS